MEIGQLVSEILKFNIYEWTDPRGGGGWGGGGGGGGTLIFSSFVGLGPASTVTKKKYQEYQAPPKNISNFCNPQKYPDSVYLP